MYCALITAGEAKARVIIFKALWKHVGTLYHNVLCDIKEQIIYHYLRPVQLPVNKIH